MKKHLVLSLFLLLSTQLFAQRLVKKEFIITEWHCDYNDYYSEKDTITLLRLLNYTTDTGLPKVHVIAYYNKAKDMVSIDFQKKSKAFLGTLTFNWCGNLEGMEEWTWDFNETLQVLSLYADNKLNASFRVIDRKVVKEEWTYEVNKGKLTLFDTEFNILKLYRIQ